MGTFYCQNMGSPELDSLIEYWCKIGILKMVQYKLDKTIWGTKNSLEKGRE